MAKATVKQTSADIDATIAEFDEKLASGEMSVHQHEIAVRLTREAPASNVVSGPDAE